MLQLGTGTLRIMDIETGEDLGVINEIPEIPKLAAGGMIEESFIGVDFCEACEGSFNAIIKPDAAERFKRFIFKGTNNWRKRHHIPMMRKIYRGGK